MQRKYLFTVNITKKGMIKLSKPAVAAFGVPPGEKVALFITKGGIVGVPHKYLYSGCCDRIAAALKPMGMGGEGTEELDAACIEGDKALKQAEEEEEERHKGEPPSPP